MDEREQQIVRTFEEFKEFGLVEDEEGVTIDADSAQGILVKKVDEHEHAIDVAYEKNKSQRTSHLTKTALLRIMIDGGTDDDIRRHIDENGLSTQHSVEYRREEAIKSIGVVKSKAEKARHVAARGIDVRLKEDEFRSLDDTLSHILERGTLSTVDQGSMRLLFGFAVLPDDQVSLPVVTQLKSNAAGILRHKLAVADKAKLFTGSPRALEGEGLLYRTVNRTRTGYPTVQSIAETIAFDKESHTKAAYTHDVERNQAMIETYISEALDILYPENVDISE